jgi:hypothetical protein
MDQVLGHEHTTNPPIIITPIADIPIIEASGSPRPTTPYPVSSQDEEDPDSPNPFNTGKKLKRKKNDKSEAIIDLMMQGLEIKESEIEQRKKEREVHEAILARFEEREQKLVDFREILVKHVVRE